MREGKEVYVLICDMLLSTKNAIYVYIHTSYIYAYIMKSTNFINPKA